MDDLIEIDPELLLREDYQVPRYTSYPTAVQFKAIKEEDYLVRLQRALPPLSLYIHLPFCKTMCLFCACSVVLNRDPKKQFDYLQSVLQEIRLLAKEFKTKRTVNQIHFGGGTPTNLTKEELQTLFLCLQEHFSIVINAEISIEIDTRNVLYDNGKKISFIKDLGFNRISFGVQDADPKVQEAVRRRQSWEMTERTFFLAKKLGFSSINLDLIYGLPYQTPASFRVTAEKILELNPDRIAFFSYARVPNLKPHQKAIQESTLPSTIDKFRIYVEARAKFMRAGYIPIGMDHFAKKSDSLSTGLKEKKLYRNFQGYSLELAENLIGIGITAIGYVEGCYIQNEKTIPLYQEKIKSGFLPIFRGWILSEEDHRRRYIIQRLMCDFELDKEEFAKKFNICFDAHFLFLQKRRESFIQKRFIEEDDKKLKVTALGKLFVRNVAALFDQYFSTNEKNFFSNSV